MGRREQRVPEEAAACKPANSKGHHPCTQPRSPRARPQASVPASRTSSLSRPSFDRQNAPGDGGTRKPSQSSASSKQSIEKVRVCGLRHDSRGKGLRRILVTDVNGASSKKAAEARMAQTCDLFSGPRRVERQECDGLQAIGSAG